MSGHGPIFEWQDYPLEDLKKALEHMKALDSLNIPCASQDLQYSIAQEIKAREEEEEEKMSTDSPS